MWAEFGLNQADYQELLRLTGERLILVDVRVASFLDPSLQNQTEPNRYENLSRIAQIISANAIRAEGAMDPKNGLSADVSQLLNAEERRLLLDALNYFNHLISEFEAPAVDLSKKRADGEYCCNDTTRSVLFLLHIQASRVAREVHWLLTGGFSSAAWARWRTLHELAVASATIVESKDQRIAERYLARSFALKARWIRDCHAYGLLSDSEAARLESELAGKLADSSANDHIATSGDDYSWAIKIPDERSTERNEMHRKKRLRRGSGGFRTIEDLAGLSHFRPFYTLANSSVHADAASLYATVPSDGGTLVSGPSPAELYLPVHLVLQSLRITLISILFGSAVQADNSLGVINLPDYFDAVILPYYLATHCDGLFASASDTMRDR
jgi:hypothetical protein